MFEEYRVVFVHPCPEEGSENMRFIVKPSQTVCEEYQVVFVHPCSKEDSENMRFIVNVESSPPASSQGNPLQVICPYVPSTIHAFSTALCGASTSVSLVLSEFTCVLWSRDRAI